MGKTALVTGSNGFIAQHLIRQITIYPDWNIIALSKNEPRFTHNINTEYIIHDLREKLPKTLGNIDYIFHLAVSDMHGSLQNFVQCLKNNHLITLNVLDFARELSSLQMLQLILQAWYMVVER